MSDIRAKAELDRLYAELPTIDCQRRCHDSCGPIAMSRVEWQRICKRAGERRATSITCPYLTGDRLCGVYTIRPMICRLWGIIETMPCPWGCKPERYLTTAEGYDFLLRADLISQPEQAEAIEAHRRLLRERPDLVAFSKWLHEPPKSREVARDL